MRNWTLLVLSGLLGLAWVLPGGSEAAGVVGRVPTARWFLPRRTFTKLLVDTSVVTQTAASSCVLIAPDLPPCRGARADLIRPTASSQEAILKTTTPNSNDEEEKLAGWLSASLDHSWDLLDQEKPRNWDLVGVSASIESKEHPKYEIVGPSSDSWGFFGFNLDTTITRTVTLHETTRIYDPETAVTFSVTGCKPSKLPFDIAACDDTQMKDAAIKPTVSTMLTVTMKKNDHIDEEHVSVDDKYDPLVVSDAVRAEIPLAVREKMPNISVTHTEIDTPSADAMKNLSAPLVSGDDVKLVGEENIEDEKSNINKNVEEKEGGGREEEEENDSTPSMTLAKDDTKISVSNKIIEDVSLTIDQSDPIMISSSPDADSVSDSEQRVVVIALDNGDNIMGEKIMEKQAATVTDRVVAPTTSVSGAKVIDKTADAQPEAIATDTTSPAIINETTAAIDNANDNGIVIIQNEDNTSLINKINIVNPTSVDAVPIKLDTSLTVEERRENQESENKSRKDIIKDEEDKAVEENSAASVDDGIAVPVLLDSTEQIAQTSALQENTNIVEEKITEVPVEMKIKNDIEEIATEPSPSVSLENSNIVEKNTADTVEEKSIVNPTMDSTIDTQSESMHEVKSSEEIEEKTQLENSKKEEKEIQDSSEESTSHIEHSIMETNVKEKNVPEEMKHTSEMTEEEKEKIHRDIALTAEDKISPITLAPVTVDEAATTLHAIDEMQSDEAPITVQEHETNPESVVTLGQDSLRQIEGLQPVFTSEPHVDHDETRAEPLHQQQQPPDSPPVAMETSDGAVQQVESKEQLATKSASV